MNNKINSSYKVIADHLRSSSFLIADGVMPSNEGRGYVLRRIMRRALLHCHKINPTKTFFYKLIPSLVNEMSKAYPELKEAEALITENLKIEEEKFRKTVNKGMEILETELKNTKNNKFSGSTAFKLYDTYGFPLDLTENILKEKNIEVDVEKFESEMQQQKERARKAWSGSGSTADNEIFFNIKEKFGATEALMYKSEKSAANILAIIKEGKRVQEVDKGDKNVFIILNQTPFYATSGGQRGDEGKIFHENGFLEINETLKKADNLFVHSVSQIEGKFTVGDEITAQVNRRSGKKRAHSATHLLHYILRNNLGKQLTQKGSDVSNDSFTFDFNHNDKIDSQILEKIEKEVNDLISQKTDTTTETMKIEDAKQKGAVALFGEKYGDVVRVLSMGKDENGKDLSVEFCGGTHVENLGDIGCFKIISEKSIASGIRRITAYTSKNAINWMQTKLDDFKDDYYKKFDDFSKKNKIIKGSDIKKIDIKIEFNNKSDIDKISEFLDKRKDLETQTLELNEKLKKINKEIEKKKKYALTSGVNFAEERIGSINLIHHYFEDVNAKDLRETITQIKSQKDNRENTTICFFSSFAEKVAVALAISTDLNDKLDAGNIIPQIVEKIGGKGGGGKPDIAFGGGSNKDGINDAVEKLKELIG